MQLKQQFTEQETKYQQQEERLKLQLEELNKENETTTDKLKSTVAEKEQQLAEPRAYDHGTSKNENNGSISPEIISSIFSFASSDIQVCTNAHVYMCITKTCECIK